MTGKLLLPPAFEVKKLWPRAARKLAEDIAIYTLRDVAAQAAGAQVTLTWAGGVAPMGVDWGDASPTEGDVTSPAVHVYAASSAYQIALEDSAGQQAWVNVNVLVP